MCFVAVAPARGKTTPGGNLNIFCKPSACFVWLWHHEVNFFFLGTVARSAEHKHSNMSCHLVPPIPKSTNQQKIRIPVVETKSTQETYNANGRKKRMPKAAQETWAAHFSRQTPNQDKHQTCTNIESSNYRNLVSIDCFFLLVPSMRLHIR